VDEFEVDFALKLQDLVMMLDESWQNFDVLVETILPKAFPQLDV
jgi:hypothetical protein